MKTSKITLITSNLMFAAVLAILTGCASKGYEKANVTGTALQAAAEKINQGNAQLTRVMAALNNLVERPQPDLRPQFDKFSADLNDLQSLAQDVNDKATDMQAKGQGYFADWNQQLAAIQNEDIRAHSEERKKEVQAKFQTINGSYQDAKTLFTPFMSDLQDIKTYLSSDLTAGGIDSIKKTVAKANKEVPSLQKAIGKLGDDFKALGVSLSSTTSTTE
jgi:DNA repair exonuclease SbcCD ATPase subunit